jgi:peptidoglycan hydrolase CwlO-like protein
MRKLSSKTAVAILGVVCVLLAAWLVEVTIAKDEIIADKDSAISSLNSQADSLSHQIAQRAAELYSLNASLNAKDGEIQNLTNSRDQLLSWLKGNVTLLPKRR